MAFKLVVEIKVVNEDNEVVDHRGMSELTGRTHHPLHTQQDFREYVHVENAHASMNTLHATIKNLTELR